MALADSYRYIDDNGNIHFTDNPHYIPDDKKKDVKIYETLEEDNKKKTTPAAPKEALVPQGNVQNSEAYNKLAEEKEALDKEYESLSKEKEAILEVSKDIDNLSHEEKRTLQDRVNKNNEKIKAFNIKQKDFNNRVQAYNENIKQDQAQQGKTEN